MFKVMPSRHCKNWLLNLQKKNALFWYSISVRVLYSYSQNIGTVFNSVLILPKPDRPTHFSKTLQGFHASRSRYIAYLLCYYFWICIFVKLGRRIGAGDWQGDNLETLLREVKVSGKRSNKQKRSWKSWLRRFSNWSFTQRGFWRPGVDEKSLIMIPPLRVL